MNTRLQVEHPVTECVLGLDLVAEQLRIAAGAGLPFTQEQVVPVGHAIECRICAEEPEHDFRARDRPNRGSAGPGAANVRFDGGVGIGQAITPAFDSMLAKLVVHAPTRGEAAAPWRGALDALVLLGVPTNIDYLARVLRHPQFLAGKLHTGFLTAHAHELAAPDRPAERAAAVLSALLTTRSSSGPRWRPRSRTPRSAPGATECGCEPQLSASTGSRARRRSSRCDLTCAFASRSSCTASAAFG